MDARSTLTPQQAFVAGPDDIKKIAKLLSDRIGSLTFHATSADAIERQYTDAKVLCESENPWPKRIVDLRFSAQSDDWKKRVSVRLSESRYWAIDVEINASEGVVERLRQDLIDIIGGMKPWYSRIARIDFVLGGLLLFTAASIIVNVMLAVGWLKSRDWSPSEKARNEALGVSLVFGIFVLGWGINRIRQWAFPAGLITIGQVQKRHDFLEKIRWTVVVGFLVSFAASVAVLLL